MHSMSAAANRTKVSNEKRRLSRQPASPQRTNLAELPASGHLHRTEAGLSLELLKLTWRKLGMEWKTWALSSQKKSVNQPSVGVQGRERVNLWGQKRYGFCFINSRLEFGKIDLRGNKKLLGSRKQRQ